MEHDAHCLYLETGDINDCTCEDGGDEQVEFGLDPGEREPDDWLGYE